jgi:hypothetical protein
VRYLETLGLNISYPKIAQKLADLVHKVEDRVYAGTLHIHAGEIVPEDYPEIRVFADATGVGKPVLDILQAAGVRVTGVYFTHGDRRVEAVDERTGLLQVTLGKAYMVSRLQALLQTRRLHVPRGAQSEVLTHELLNYEIKVDQSANDRYGAFKVGTHDDLVTALGLCVQEPVLLPGTGAAAPGYQPQEIPEWATAVVVGARSGRMQPEDWTLRTGLVGIRDDYLRYGGG